MALDGFRLAAPTEAWTGSALGGRAVLFRWPAEGRIRRIAARQGPGVLTHGRRWARAL